MLALFFSRIGKFVLIENEIGKNEENDKAFGMTFYFEKF